MLENYSSSKPTILFVAPSAYPFGGVADWLEYLMFGLEERGWGCTLGLVQGRYHLLEPYLARHPWHDVERICNPTGSREGRKNAISRTIMKVRPDILAVTNIVDAYAAIRRLRLQGTATPQVAMTLHGLQGDLLADVSAECDVLDAVVVTNRLTHRLAAECLGYANRVYYASYGARLHEHSVEPPLKRHGQIRLLFCGRLEQNQKRIFDLPDLMLNLRKHGLVAELSVAGGGPDEAALSKRIVSHGLQNEVRFLGTLDAHELAREYCNHDALIITSSWETGPIVVWEAMSHGLPVLSSRYVGSGLEGALVDGINCLLFPIGDMQMAAACVEKLLAVELRKKIVRGGLELVRTRYSREASVVQWASAFERLLMLPRLPKPAVRPLTSNNGRLDRLFGQALAERIRRALRISYIHDDAGGEWPHTAHAHVDQPTWLAGASRADIVR